MRNLLRLGEIELTDLGIFKKFVTLHYAPSKFPKIMCVGASNVNEGAMLRKYHEEQFGLNGNTRIAACNIIPYPEILARGQYDLQINDRALGDAKLNTPYQLAQGSFGSYCPFDLVYIRNPDINVADYWADIFQSAIQQISKNGGSCDFNKIN